MKILLDENMPRKLLGALIAEGQEVDSVKSLKLQGIDNGALYHWLCLVTIFALHVTLSFQSESSRNLLRV